MAESFQLRSHPYLLVMSANLLYTHGSTFVSSKVTGNLILPVGDYGRLKFYVVESVSDTADIKHIGEIFVPVLPSATNPYDQVMTVGTIVGSGLMAARNLARRKKVDEARLELIAKVRTDLLNYWAELLEVGYQPQSALLATLSNDMELVRTYLRKDAYARLKAAIMLTDALGRVNPAATAARLTAAIRRIDEQIGLDETSRRSIDNRLGLGMLLRDAILEDVNDIHLLASSEYKPWFGREVEKRLDRMAIKPWYFAVVLIKSQVSPSQYADQGALEYMAQVFTNEQLISEIEILLSRLKAAHGNEQYQYRRLISLMLNRLDIQPYKTLARVLNDYLNQLESLNSVNSSSAAGVVEHMQNCIRYRNNPNYAEVWPSHS